jgi:hypothetical protein
MWAIQQIWEELCELKLRERNWHKISPQGWRRNSESDFAAFTLSSCLLLCVIIVQLPWGKPFWGDFTHSFCRYGLNVANSTFCLLQAWWLCAIFYYEKILCSSGSPPLFSVTRWGNFAPKSALHSLLGTHQGLSNDIKSTQRFCKEYGDMIVYLAYFIV